MYKSGEEPTQPVNTKRKRCMTQTLGGKKSIKLTGAEKGVFVNPKEKKNTRRATGDAYPQRLKRSFFLKKGIKKK